jgi:hypothetical protein
MPYDPGDPSSLPAYVRSLPAKRQRQWAHIWNATYQRCMDGAEPNSGNCESKAFSVASGVTIRQKGKAKHAMGRKASFKTLSYGERQKIPKRKFLYVDSSGVPHLPVHDTAHIRNAISRLGQSKTGRKWGLTAEKRASLQARARRMLDRAQHNQGPPISPHADLAMDVATFKLKSEPLRVTDDVVYHAATVFRAGDYPDKKFSLTPSELKDAAAAFTQPVPLDYEHVEGPLDGQLGQLVAVEPNANGSKLHGMVAIPRWLDRLLPQQAKLSATWDRASKKLVGLALVRNPRVSDAALMAAFSVDQIERGKQPLSSLLQFNGWHNGNGKNDDDDNDDDDDKNGNNGKDKNPFLKLAKKRNKAVAKAKKNAGKFSGYDGMVPVGGWESQSGGARDGAKSKPGRSSLAATVKFNKTRAMAQAIHDISTSKGAFCKTEPQPATGAPGPYGIVRFDKQGRPRIRQKDLAKFQGGKAMQGIHDVSTAMGAVCAPTLYGQRDVADAGPFQWQYPGVKDEGRRSIVAGGMTRPHFSQKEGKRSMGKKKSEAAFSKMLETLDQQTGVFTPGGYAYSGKKSRGAQPGAADRALVERNAQLEEDNRKMRQQRIYDSAVAFADKAVEQGRILPAEREQVLRQHMQAGHDDEFIGTTSFSEGNSRVAQFEEWILARPKHGMDIEATQEALRDAAAVFNNMRTTLVPGARNTPGVESGAPMTPERRSYLLNLAESGTITGRNLARPPANGTAH